MCLTTRGQAPGSAASISSRSISSLSHCSSATASSSRATASATVVAPNLAGSRAYRSGSAKTTFSSAIWVSNAAIRAGSMASARRSLKFIRRGRPDGNAPLCVAGWADNPAQDADPADVLPESRAGPPVSKIGDLWLLGRNRLLCGSALDTLAFTALMGEERAATVFIDPPYNVEVDGHASGLGAIHHRPFPMAAGEMGKAEFTAFLGQALRNLAAFSAAGSLHYMCMDWRHLDELLAAGAEAYGELKNLCVWVKDNAGMGSLYRSQHELVLVFKQCGGSHRNKVQLGQFGRNRSNVWNYPGANSFARCGAEGNLLALHPTVKPVALVADALLDCTERGGLG